MLTLKALAKWFTAKNDPRESPLEIAESIARRLGYPVEGAIEWTSREGATTFLEEFCGQTLAYTIERRFHLLTHEPFYRCSITGDMGRIIGAHTAGTMAGAILGAISARLSNAHLS